MASQVKVVQAFLSAFGRCDLDGVLAQLDPDVYFVPSGNDLAPSHGDFSGHAGFSRWWKRETSRGFNVRPVAFVELDDERVLAEVESGLPDGGGTLVSRPRAVVFTVSDGLITAIEVFANPDDGY